MKKRIWILNHYATLMMVDKNGRHYNFAKYLQQDNYEVTIICANTVHNSEKIFTVENGLYRIEVIDGVKYVIVKTVPYSGNVLSRILNMLIFARNLKKTANRLIKGSDTPDVILASSVHPWTVQAGLKIAKKHHIPCICEIRDLWPETLISLNYISPKSLITKYLQNKEKFLYEHADRIVFTMEGGPDYIRDMHWDTDNGGKIDLSKVNHINNGVDLSLFDLHASQYSRLFSDMFREGFVNFIYAGSLRAANDINIVLRPFVRLLNEGHKINFIVVGDGPDRDRLQRLYQHCEYIHFVGRVEKEKVPALLIQSDVAVLCYHSLAVFKYGGSHNKLFEYMAAGKPVLSTIRSGYDLISANHFGLSLADCNEDAVYDAIKHLTLLPKEELVKMGVLARKTVKNFDFKVLSKELSAVIDDVTVEERV